MMNKLKYIVLGLLFFCTVNVSAQQFALKTNGLMWGALMPNVGGEVVFGERFSFDLSAFGGYKPYKVDAKLFGLNPEVKYWFSGRPMVRHYIGLAFLGVSYDMKFKEKQFDGKAGGAGLSFGYSWLLSERLNLEISAGFGAVYFRQRRLYSSDNTTDYEIFSKKKENSTGVKLMPTKIALSISYIIR